MNNLTDVIPKLVEYDFYPTGSRSFDCATRESDWDWCFREKDYGEIFEHLESQGIKITQSSGYSNSFKFNCSPDSSLFEGNGLFNTCVFNFIFLNDENFDAWKIATEVMPFHLQKISTTVVKSKRIRLFQELVIFYGGSY